MRVIPSGKCSVYWQVYDAVAFLKNSFGNSRRASDAGCVSINYGLYEYLIVAI